MNHVKFGHFVNFSYIFFGQKFRAPLKLTELLRLWPHVPTLPQAARLGYSYLRDSGSWDLQKFV